MLGLSKKKQLEIERDTIVELYKTVDKVNDRLFETNEALKQIIKDVGMGEQFCALCEKKCGKIPKECMERVLSDDECINRLVGFYCDKKAD